MHRCRRHSRRGRHLSEKRLSPNSSIELSLLEGTPPPTLAEFLGTKRLEAVAPHTMSTENVKS